MNIKALSYSITRNDYSRVAILSVLFTILLFSKTIIFHHATFHSIPLSSLWKNPLFFISFYYPKLLLPEFLASFIFITKKHRWWTIIVAFVFDLWCIANILYYKTYDSFVTVDSVKLAGNLNGFFSSIYAFIDWKIALLLLLTVLWGGVIFVNKHYNQHRHYISCLVCIIIALLLTVADNYYNYGVKGYVYTTDINSNTDQFKGTIIEKEQLNRNPLFKYAPLAEISFLAKTHTSALNHGTTLSTIQHNWIKPYISRNSILDYFFAAITYYVFFDAPDKGELIKLSNEEASSIDKLLLDSINTYNTPVQGCLIMILVESLESWPIENDIDGYTVAPNLRILAENSNAFYAPNLKCQTRLGNSGDGQMILNTGLLPLERGVACIDYAHNTYPAIASRFSVSKTVNTCRNIWNQDTMSIRYGYDKLIQPDEGEWTDMDVLNITNNEIQKTSSSLCVQTITIAMHAPFDRVETSTFDFDKNVPKMIRNYLTCLHYTDSCLGVFMNHIMEKNPNATVVITGDHTIFKPTMLEEFNSSNKTYKLPLTNGENYIPLIIYSPTIESNTRTDDICYQMDIYPTIISLLGKEKFIWQGLGVNLMDSTARSNRKISEQEAFRLSDLIIRSNYFSTRNFSKNRTDTNE